MSSSMIIVIIIIAFAVISMLQKVGNPGFVEI